MILNGHVQQVCEDGRGVIIGRGKIYLKSMHLKSIAKSMPSVASESGDSLLNGHQTNNISITKWLQL